MQKDILEGTRTLNLEIRSLTPYPVRPRGLIGFNNATIPVSKNSASTWARTRDLSVNSRALCQLSHGGTTTGDPKSVHPAGFEPAPSSEDYDLNVAC